MTTNVKFQAEAGESMLPPFGTYIGTVKRIEEMEARPNPFKEGEQQIQVKIVIEINDVNSVDFEDDEEAADEAVGTEAWAYATSAAIDASGNVRPVFTPRSKLRQWCQAIAGREIEDGEEFDASTEVISKQCMFTVAPNTKDNPTVSDIRGYRKRKKAKRAKKPEPEPEIEEDEDDDDLVDEDF